MLEKTYRIKWSDRLALPLGIIYPHKPAPVIVAMNAEPELRLMNFSLVPSWSKERKPKYVTYNARIEEVLNKPSWKEPFKSRHCLVPMQFFIESVYEGPFAGHNIAISDSRHQLMTAAGIWDTWVDRTTGEVLDSFAILTCEPSPEILQAGHDRSPIFLKESAWASWLKAFDSDFKRNPEGSVQKLLADQDEIRFEFQQREALKNFR